MEKKRFSISTIIAILMGVGAIVVFTPVLLFVLIPIGVICLEQFWDDILLWGASLYDKRRK
ncbi:hypothetical protein [Anaeromicrobium sediminis]|uniref:hypothetical protein n=1 Tax=Anaeromicrobium sediminis TaxID=1478221 RepID=UPI00113FD83F|nr:hypothetical protein [Anaeromicrobium sediminis]